MADTYEKDLAQKTSLTTNDFIRVVGSDNVSYKQLVSDVRDKFGVSYISSLAQLNTLVSNIGNGIPFVVGVYSTELVSLFSQGGSAAGSAQIFGTRRNATTLQYALWIYNADLTFTGTYNFSAGTVSNVFKNPTRAEVDALASDSGWIELTTNVKYRKVGKICYVNIDGYTATQTSGAETIGTLPEGYRPTVTAQWCGRKGASTLLGGWVTSAGLIRYTAVSASGTIAALVTFPVG